MNATTSEITSTKPGITRTVINFILRRSGNVIRNRSVARWPWRITELALLLGASVIVAGCGGDGSGDSKDGSVLVVGMDLTYPPFEMLNPKGQPDGVSVRLAEGLAKYLGRDLKIENINLFRSEIDFLQFFVDGKIDMFRFFCRQEQRFCFYVLWHARTGGLSLSENPRRLIPRKEYRR